MADCVVHTDFVVVKMAAESKGEMEAMTDNAQTKLLEYIELNPKVAESLCQAASTITECDQNGKPIRKTVAPDDFSDAEWAALVAVANLIVE